MMPLELSAAARNARLEESVRINKLVCRMFDDLDSKLNAGTLAPADRLRLGQECLDAVGASLHTVMDHVNMSTFFHRISRLVTHNAMAPVVQELDTSRVMPVLVQRFEGLLDRILRSKAHAGGRGGSAASGNGPSPAGSGGGGGRSANAEPELTLPVRSLATSFWALGNMGYPLSSEQLDKIAGVLTLKYSEIRPDHLSMLLMGLNAFPEARFSSKLQRLLLECCVHMPPSQFEARVATNTLCAAASSKVVPSLDVIERLSLLALATLPDCNKDNLGSLTWALGKLGCRVGKSRIDPALLHAITATVWRNLEEMKPKPLSNVLYGFALLNFHPGTEFLDAAAARMLQLLPRMDTSDVVNTMWSFARLEYSPDPDRELWAIAPSRPAARWTPPVRDGGSWGWGGQEGEDGDASAADREEERWLTTQEQRARAQERALQSLAQRVAAQRARREAFSRLLSYAREAVTTALARTPAARKSEADEKADATGKAVREEHMADLVHFIRTGQTNWPRGTRVVKQPIGMSAGWEEWVDPKTGMIIGRPRYSRQQLSLLMPPVLRRPGNASSAAAAAAELEQLAVGGSAEGEQAAGGSELESLDAFAAAAAAEVWQPPGEAEEAAGSGSGQAAEVIEDPDLVDAEEEEEDKADLPAGGGGSVAAGLELDLDAMQAGEESEEESEEEEEEEAAAAAAALSGGSGAAASSESIADILLRLREEERAAAAGPTSAAGRSALSAAALVARVGNLTPEQLQQLDGPTQQALRQRVEQLRQQRREVRTARKAAKVAARTTAAAGGDQADWREHCESPEQLRDFLYSDGRRFTVPSSVQKRWRDAERLTFEHAAERLLPAAPRLTGGEVSTVMWSFATARHVHPELFQALLQRADGLADTLAWRSIGIIMWSSAVTMQRPSRRLANRLVDRFGPLFNKHVDQRYDLHALCNLTWSLAVFDYLTPQRFSELLGYVPRDSHAYASISTPGWFQFFQCALHLEAKTGRSHSDFLPPDLLPYAEQAWARKETTTSRLQNKVADVLHSLGVPFAEEYAPRGNFFNVDIAIMEGNTKLAVEVDGPQHFSANAPHVPLASTCMRNSLLASAGWKVVSIPFNEWAQLAGLEQKQEYLREHVLSQLPKSKSRKR
ncbi:RAP domain [Chlorella sorokiniana]|uniref:RAP domain n=1 Tax=Chlorella sorokiniana TaxID=3076 RepID=A0A2P6THP1_CHLSO|nr:RAP domain [Chlorella sorokiniana]|eukprot:PRW33797.1 RAP domain [Chlorella sorokiniana]